MQIDIQVDAGISGHWAVEEFEVSKKDADFHNMRSMFQPGSRGISAGKYKRLVRNNYTVMSNTPAEIRDHIFFINKAKQGKHVLINGLGLGVALTAILESELIESITVIEKSQDVINLVSPYFNDPRLEIIHCDAFDYKPPKNKRFDAVWHDIWDDITPDNLPGMTKLHRKYGSKTDWQGSWCKELCKRYR